MGLKGDLYSYIVVYVDDLAIVANDPKIIISLLEDKYKFKLKSTGYIKYHLSIDFHHSKNNGICMLPTEYIEKICESFERIFGHPHKKNCKAYIEKVTP